MKRLTALIPLFIGAIVAFYMYNKPHVNVNEADVDFEVSVDSLAQEFQSTPENANLKYANKIVLLSGKFNSQSISENHITTILMKGEENIANCEMDSVYLQGFIPFQPDDEVRMKGLFVGYDDLLGELQLKKCLLIPN